MPNRHPLGSMALCLVERRTWVGLIVDYQGRLRKVGVLIATRDNCSARVRLRQKLLESKVSTGKDMFSDRGACHAPQQEPVVIL